MIGTRFLRRTILTRQGLALFEEAGAAKYSPAVRTRALRFSSSNATTTAASPQFLSTRMIALLSAASSIGGLAGYFLADRNGSGKATHSKPQYGSPQDCSQAIEELRKTFADDADAVSTNVDDIYVHGFSANDYHPGKS